MKNQTGTLRADEFHPMAQSAFDFVKKYIKKNPMMLESLASCALSDDNRTAQICYETLRRVIYEEPVSDRYLLGLAWFLLYRVVDNENV
jgi:hypothetical protein